MKITSTKQSQLFKVPSKQFNDLPFLTRTKLQQLWDNASENGILHKIYLEENKQSHVCFDGSVSWSELAGIDLSKNISDYTSKEILTISNKAKKLAYKNDTMSISKLRKIWTDAIRLEKEFVAKQTHLSGKNYTIMGIKWRDMIGMNKNFNYCSEREILGMYEMAKWYCEADLLRYECQCCGMSYFYIDDENEKDYLRTIWIKNKCHSLSGDKEIGYGSLLDGSEDENRVKVNICDDCLCGMKS